MSLSTQLTLLAALIGLFSGGLIGYLLGIHTVLKDYHEHAQRQEPGEGLKALRATTQSNTAGLPAFYDWQVHE